MNELFKRSFLFNLVVVAALCIALYMLFFASLSFITGHGNEVKVPQVQGKTVKAAIALLESQGFEVEVDSAYDPKQKPFIILIQSPEYNATVKEGRLIFLTVNKAEPPLTPMPNLLNMSFRSAEMLLKSNKLILGDTTFRPDIAKGAILEQLYKGQPIRPGQMLPQGSRIDLVIGDGLGNTQFNVPDVIGMPYMEAINILSSTGLMYTPIWDPNITDSTTAIIYDQQPKPFNELNAPNRIKEGDNVDILIKQNPTTEEMEGNRKPAGEVITDDQNVAPE